MFVHKIRAVYLILSQQTILHTHLDSLSLHSHSTTMIITAKIGILYLLGAVSYSAEVKI